ncbi:2Fe-2S iron-sulfur cluster-binding protein [Streptomyces goshikiensis]|uniref:2Fe-2S iron-sulfur cluster-binding protein n=1 Tax=Streptomyces goshikiensis TaxID=1942 RepID=UPI00365B56C4
MQEAWLEQGVSQCGFCRPDRIMAADPTDEDIDLIANICRCGAYFRIRQADHGRRADVTGPMA